MGPAHLALNIIKFDSEVSFFRGLKYSLEQEILSLIQRMLGLNRELGPLPDVQL